jgi:hypothetical protein
MNKHKNIDNFPKIIDRIVNWRLKLEKETLEKSHIKFSLNQSLELNEVLVKSHALEKLPKLSIKKYRLFLDSIKKNGLNRDDVKMYQTYRDRLPLDIFGFAYGLKSFKSTQQKSLRSTTKFKAGYYFLELGANIKVGSARVKLSLTTTPKKIESPTSLQLHHGNISKRMIYSESDFYLTLNFNEPIFNDIFHMKLIRITKNFFIDRACKKIGIVNSPSYLKKLNQNDGLFKYLLEQYNSRFEDTRNPNFSYDEYIREYEKQKIPAKVEQIKNLQRWKIFHKK